ncbi:MAG: amidase family protein [Methanomassiliicoccaceae archaeon]|nr:amidase family protein [Methanomassiliicoccaceae archaeon]
MRHISLNERYHMFSEAASSYEDKKLTFSLSDDIVATGFTASAGSRILEGHRPVYDSTVSARMRAAGGSLIGKTNMDEFGIGMFSVTGTDIPKNPFDLARSCGGPCGGAACAASLLDGHVALATSAGGGISVPASFCGVLGLTPTHGRISRHGLIDSVSSMGPIGIMATNADLLRRYLKVISSGDPNDPVSAAQPDLVLGKSKLKAVAVPNGITDLVSTGVREAFDRSVGTLRDMSVDVEYVDIPELDYSMSAHYILATAETALNLATYCGMRVGQQSGDMSLPFDDYFTSFRTKYFGTGVKKRIVAGTYMTLGDNRNELYMRSLGIRRLVMSRYEEILSEYDAILTPSTPITAPTFDEVSGIRYTDEYLTGRFAVPPVFCGLPCLSVPCGYPDGVPAGLQFTAARWNEDVLTDAAAAWEKAFDIKAPEASL